MLSGVSTQDYGYFNITEFSCKFSLLTIVVIVIRLAYPIQPNYLQKPFHIKSLFVFEYIIHGSSESVRQYGNGFGLTVFIFEF